MLTIGASSDGSASYASMQALQRSLSNHSDSVNFSVTAPGGDPESIRAYDNDELDGYTAGNFIFKQAVDKGEPFSGQAVENFPYLGFSYLSLHMHWLAVEGVNVNSIEEAVEKDLNIWVGPPGWGLRTLCVNIMEEAGLGDIKNTVDVSAEDVASQIDEGRIDVFFAYGTNGRSLPSWMVEVDSRASVHALKMSDDYVTAIKNSEAGFAEVEPYGYKQDIGMDQYQAWTDDYNTYFSPDVPAKAVKEVLQTTHKHWKEARESDSNYMDHSDPKSLTEYYHTNTPVHPGAADFLKENNAWNDSWKRGE